MLASCSKTVTLHHPLSYVTPHMITPGTCTPSLSSTLSSSHPLVSQLQSCGDLRPHPSGPLAEPGPFRGYEPRQLLKTGITGISPETISLLNTRIYVSNLLSFLQPITASTYDSAESIMTPPPDSDLDDEQIRDMLSLLLYLQEREANAERS